jgi:hypothetical protein
MQLFNAIPEFKKAIMDSSSSHPLVVGFKEIFKDLNSPGGIPRDQLKNSLSKIFAALNNARGTSFALNSQDDACLLIKSCLCLLGGANYEETSSGCAGAIDEETLKCFRFQWRSVTKGKDDPSNQETYYYYRKWALVLDLPISQTPVRKENSGEFMKALESLKQREETRKKINKVEVDAICCKQIIDPPPVLLVKIMRLGQSSSGSLIKIDHPMTIPLGFEVPGEIVADSDPANYELIGGVVHSGTVNGGHYIAYIRTKGGFFEFNDSYVQKLTNEQGLEILKRGAYVLAYRRKNQIKKPLTW